MQIAPPEQGHTGHTGYTGVYRVTITVGVIYFSLNARQVAIRLLDAVVLETSQVTRSARQEGTQPTAFPASPHQPDRNYFITTYSFLIFMHGSPTALIVGFSPIAGGYPFSKSPAVNVGIVACFLHTILSNDSEQPISLKRASAIALSLVRDFTTERPVVTTPED